MVVDLESDSDIEFPSSPMDTSQVPTSMQFERDPITGQFTLASFAHFSDDLVD
jgi:hypothetical protein